LNDTADLLFEYLKEIFYNASKAKLDIDKLDEEFKMVGKGLEFFAHCFGEYNALATALSRGDLQAPFPPPENELAAPLKSLYSSLRHLTWQSKQVAMGDYSQRVDFMGEFSESFNSMIQQLSDRQQQLLTEIETIKKKTAALESGNQLLTMITEYIPHQTIMMDIGTNEILFLNGSAKRSEEKNNGYIENVVDAINRQSSSKNGESEEIQYIQGEITHYLLVYTYELEWNKKSALAFFIQDISLEKNRMLELEEYAYRDEMTRLYNRFAGMMTLNKWMEQDKKFALAFVDLDNLKKINDMYGHNEGDRYIISAATRLNEISPDVVVARVGGDEFMVLIPDAGYDEAYTYMKNAYDRLIKDKYLQDKDFEYHFSYGIVEVDGHTEKSASAILSMADERMYQNKLANKAKRREEASY
jgi:diguanylate cyclase (GGDEF)-like protein